MKTLKLIAIDVCANLSEFSQAENRYFLSIIYDYSQNVFPIKNTSDVF